MLPAGEATIAGIEQLPFDLISIHASREGSDIPAMVIHDHYGISIHASREGSDIG